ncbi:MAG: hypothetical protein IKC95_07170 [Oscillospiraceae bacterium]|nr:hypothetical protein [Oscillospiraceae bacterium]
MANYTAKNVALGGVTAGLAVVIMCLLGSLGIATYVCPVLCMLLCCVVKKQCGNRIAWAWNAVVIVISALLAPDKEAVAVFFVLGYYPILKSVFDSFILSGLWKFLYFNTGITLLYSILIHTFGLVELSDDFFEFGVWGLFIVLLLGNITFLFWIPCWAVF